MQNFLLANALFWLREYHADGLRVDAVASMLYLDYSRKDGEWVPNAFGGREDLDAVAFLKELNELVHAREPGVISAAEESTAWPGVSRPTYVGGLGFGFKWNMGWMHDTLSYFQHDPIHRRFHHHELTFSLVYAWNENFILPLSHDEVVHGKGSMLAKMPGDRWQQLANLRSLYAYMWSHPGKKLLFMGGELATPWEWAHAGRAAVVAARARRARGHARPDARPEPRLPRGAGALGGRLLARGLRLDRAERRDGEHRSRSCASRPTGRARSSASRTSRRCRARTTASGCRAGGAWQELLNTDSTHYGGTGVGNLGEVTAEERGVARPAVLRRGDAAAAGGRVAATGRASRRRVQLSLVPVPGTVTGASQLVHRVARRSGAGEWLCGWDARLTWRYRTRLCRTPPDRPSPAPTTRAGAPRHVAVLAVAALEERGHRARRACDHDHGPDLEQDVDDLAAGRQRVPDLRGDRQELNRREEEARRRSVWMSPPCTPSLEDVDQRQFR